MALVSKAFGDIITFTRASTGTFFSSAGVLTSAAINTPRFDYNPSTLAAQGFLIEEARTNSIRNNTMVGAVAGTPGTLPTNWVVFTNVTGLTRQIVGTGTENGVTYIEVKLSGTPSGSGVYQFQFEPSNVIAALTAQTWTQSTYVKLQAGSYTGVSSSSFGFSEYTSGGGFVTFNTAVVASATSAALSTQRVTGTQTLNGGATTAFLLPFFQLSFSGVAIDITLRIGLPQLELGAFATSVIPTTTTALTRAADVASVNTLSPWYNASAGTLYAEVGSAPVNTIAQAAYELNDNLGGGLGRLLTRRTGGGNLATLVVDGGSTQADIGSVATVAGSATYKVASAFAVNDFALSLNGAAVVTDTSGTMPSTIARLFLGQNFGNAQVLNGYLRRIVYYPRRLSNAELQSITS
jgi:hypothetical protein